MRRRTLFQLLSAICVVSTAACFPDYTFDLVERDEPDASTSDDAATGEDAADDDAEADVSADVVSDADEGDAADGDTQEAGPDVDIPDADDAEAGPGEGGTYEPPEPDCTEASGNGLVYACVPRPPAGWSGPVALYDDAAELPVPDCPATFFQTPIFEGHAELDVAPANCSPCTCSLSGVTCSAPVAEEFASGPACGGQCGWTSQPPNPPLEFSANSCMGIEFNDSGNCPPPVSGRVSGSTPSGTASCVPSTQTPSIPPIAWHDIARACHAPSSDKGCDEGFLCAPRPSHPFEPNLCIVRLAEGDVDCPEGPYSQKFVFYRDANDTRSCTACSCGSPSNVRCEGEVKAYSGTTGCINEDGSIPLGACGGFGAATQQGDKYVKLFRAFVEAKATCLASGGTAIGTVTPTRPQTICCMP